MASPWLARSRTRSLSSTSELGPSTSTTMGTTAVSGQPMVSRSAALNEESAMPRVARGASAPGLTTGQGHLLTGVVLPPGVEGGRCDVVIVEDQGFGTTQEEFGNG